MNAASIEMMAAHRPARTVAAVAELPRPGHQDRHNSRHRVRA
jgi:hypothetical protein